MSLPHFLALRLSVLAALVLGASGCTRDFGVPPEAAPPQFLGELAGVYGLQASMPAHVGGQSYQASVPVGSVLILQHIEIPGAPTDPVLGAVLGMETGDGALGASDAGEIFFAELDDTTAIGRAQPGVGLGGAVELTKIPGGGGVLLDLEVCDGRAAPLGALRAARVCEFDPSLSGVYAGCAGGCSGCNETEAAYLGAGLLSIGAHDLFIGLPYPRTETTVLGVYDRWSACGAFASYDYAAEELGVGRLSVSEADGWLELDLEVQTRSLLQVPPPDQTNLCSFDIDCDYRFVGRRPVGTRGRTCGLPSVGLAVTAEYAGLVDRRLEVFVGLPGLGIINGDGALQGFLAQLFPGDTRSRVTDERQLLEARLEPHPTGTPLAPRPPQPGSPGPSLVFDLPARRDAPDAWVLTVTLVYDGLLDLCPDGEPSCADAARVPTDVRIPVATAMPLCLGEQGL